MKSRNFSFPLLLLLILLPLLASGAAPAGSEPHLTRLKSARGVEATMDRLESAARAKGLTVFARIDHRANARGAGMEMGAAQVLFLGNPKMGTALMRANPRAGLDLPPRILVYADDAGQAWVTYAAPDHLERLYGLNRPDLLDKMRAVLKRLVVEAAN